MIFADDNAVIEYVKQNQQPAQWVKDARDYTALCSAMVNGDGFADLLINQIEQLESTKKVEVRRKYARDIRDVFARLFLPIQNVFSATGSVKNYESGDYKLSKENMKTLMGFLSDVRDGKSIERYIENSWMNYYHTDPAGVMWLVYTSLNGKVLKIYPTYQGIGAVRHYIPRGQLVECIIYEPVIVASIKFWTIIDDKKVYTCKQDGDVITVINDDLTKTYQHPFGTVPVIINSNLIDKNGKRLSPIDGIIPLLKELARDQSIKTIYKFIQGLPIHFKMDSLCGTCNGTKKNGDDICNDCNGTGYRSGKTDVADVLIVPPPIDGMPAMEAKNIAGYVSPDLATWERFTDELQLNEGLAYKTLWGVEPVKQIQKTATEIHYDMQPQINRLNRYADVAEWVESTWTEWMINAIDNTKPKDESVSLIVYGRRYILEGIDTIQERYESAKAAGDNYGILDGLYDELLIVKYKNDPQTLLLEQKKAALEPYLHDSKEEINDYFGAEEVARKMYFQKWWNLLSQADRQGDVPTLSAKFITDFTAYLPTVKIEQPLPPKPVPPEPGANPPIN